MIGYHKDWADWFEWRDERLLLLSMEPVPAPHKAVIVRTRDWYGPDEWVVCAHERLGESDTHVVSVQFSRPREVGPAQCVFTPLEREPREFEAA
jgi:hypothetical protein